MIVGIEFTHQMGDIVLNQQSYVFDLLGVISLLGKNQQILPIDLHTTLEILHLHSWRGVGSSLFPPNRKIDLPYHHSSRHSIQSEPSKSIYA